MSRTKISSALHEELLHRAYCKIPMEKKLVFCLDLSEFLAGSDYPLFKSNYLSLQEAFVGEYWEKEDKTKRT